MLMPVDDEAINPFLHRSARRKPTLVIYLRRMVVGCTLLPLRVLGMLAIVMVAWVFAKIATIGLRKEDFDCMTGRPLAAWRQWVCAPMTYLGGRLLMLSLGFWWVPVKGRLASHSEAPILVSNHVSGLVDGSFLFRHAKLAEKSYASIPIVAPLMLATQSIFVDRSSPESRHKAKDAVLRRGENPRWPQTVIFPEGSCTNGLALIQFKIGAFNPGQPVQPVLLRYSPSRFGGFDPSFTEPLNMGTYLLGLMLQVANTLEVEYLPVMTPTPQERADGTLFAHRVQQVMSRELRVPATQHAGEDLVLATAAQKKGMPFETGLVQWEKLTQDLGGMRVKGALKILNQFKLLDPNGQGEVDFEGFAKVMQGLAQEPVTMGGGETYIPPPPSREDLQCLFNILDKQERGRIDFADYLSSAGVINGMSKDDRSAGWALAFDFHGQGKTEFDRDMVREFVGKVLPQFADRFDELFEQADLDRNGRISKEEFITFVESRHKELNLQPTLLMCNLPMRMITKDLSTDVPPADLPPTSPIQEKKQL